LKGSDSVTKCFVVRVDALLDGTEIGSDSLEFGERSLASEGGANFRGGLLGCHGGVGGFLGFTLGFDAKDETGGAECETYDSHDERELRFG
jgi:hypothetical protein